MRRLASRSLLLAAVLSGGCASTRPQPPASAKAPTAAEVSAYINAPDACALILGGGFSFENPQAMEGWLKVSGVVLDGAHLGNRPTTDVLTKGPLRWPVLVFGVQRPFPTWRSKWRRHLPFA